MADQNITVDLDANAEPLINALDNISQTADSARQSLDNVDAAGELLADGIEKAAAKIDTAPGTLDDLNASSSDAALKLGDIKDSSKKAADGIEKMKEKADAANGKLDDIKDSSKKAADGIDDMKEKADAANGKLDDIKDSSKRAADGIGEIGQSSRKAAQNVTKAGQKITDALKKIEDQVKRNPFEKFSDYTSRIKSVVSAVKKIAEPLQKLLGHLQEIGVQAQEMGTSAEYFQKLQLAGEKTGEKFEDIQAVFMQINETASKALSGDADAARKLADIGIAIDDIRGKDPQQVFETVTGALAAAGDEAISSEAALAVCGDRLTEIGDNLADLSSADVTIADEDIIPDEAVQASMELKENFDMFCRELLLLIAQSGFVQWLAKAAKVIAGIRDTFMEISDANRLIDEGEVRDLGREHNKKLDESWRGTLRTAIDKTTAFGLGELPKIWGARTLGEMLTGYKEEGKHILTDPINKDDMAKARREREEQMGAQAALAAIKAAQATRTRDAIAASKARSGSNSADRDAERAAREAARAAREAERQELQRRREEARAAMEFQRNLERQMREADRARGKASAENAGASSSSSNKKSKSRERPDPAPLSTAGSIGDKKEARRQRTHELRLARALAKQRINIKVKPVKASVIRAAVEGATAAPLKQLAAAVECLGRQTYIVK